MFKGAITALVMPFKNGKIDEEAYRAFIEWQIEQGIDGLIPCGSTGESATLSHEEHEKAISICIDQTKKRVPIIAGAGSNNTKEAIRLTAFAKKAGADAALLITPYYNKPTQEGLFQHFKAISNEVSIPIIAYNVPGRTGCNLNAHTLARIYKNVPHVIGVKEASGDINQMSNILEYTDDKFLLLSGDDSLTLTSMLLGGQGVISVTSNVMPKKVQELCQACLNKNWDTAKELHYSLEPMHRMMFIETNPIPLKAILHAMGKIQEEYRLPLCTLEEQNKQKLLEFLKTYGII